MKTKCKAHWRVWINMVTGKEILSIGLAIIVLILIVQALW